MATETSDQPKAPETIPGEVQNRILELCQGSGMQADQLLILHTVLRQFANPQLPEVVKALGEHSEVEDVRDVDVDGINYKVALTPDNKSGGFTAEAPDVKYAISHGKNPEEALENVSHAIRGVLEDIKADGE